MDDQKQFSQYEAEKYLAELFVEQVKEFIEPEAIEEATDEFLEISFDDYFQPVERKPREFKRDENGRIVLPSYRLSKRYKKAIHNDDLKFRFNLLASLGPISMIFVQQWAIPTQIISIAVLLVNYFAHARKKGASLNEDLFATLLTLKLLEKKSSKNVAIEDLLKKVNEKREVNSEDPIELSGLEKNLISLQNVKLKDGTVTGFVDTDKNGNWWTVDV